MSQIDPRLRYYQSSRRQSTIPAKRRPYMTTPETAAPKRSSGRLFKSLFALVLVFCVLSGGMHLVSAVTKRPPAPRVSAVTSPTLSQSVNAILQQNSSIQIGIALDDISLGTTQTFGSTSTFEAASTAKLVTACAYYHMVETGQASLSAPLGDYDAQFQLKAMINQSSNDSWDLLVGAIGDDALENYASSIGVNYDIENNALTPAGLASLLSQLYAGKLLNQTDTAQLLSYMQNTNDDTLIPAAVSSDITVYHKYGLLNGNLHDAAILTKGDKSYALVIYTKNADDSDDQQRTTLIHQLTQAIVPKLFS